MSESINVYVISNVIESDWKEENDLTRKIIIYFLDELGLFQEQFHLQISFMYVLSLFLSPFKFLTAKIITRGCL